MTRPSLFSLPRFLVLLPFLGAAPVLAASWEGDLAPISAGDWNAQRAAHLLERAGFGGTPEEIAFLAGMTPQNAVRYLVRYQSIPDTLAPFDESGAHDPGLEPFPPSRPAATDMAKKAGEALGVKVKPSGNRRLQPVAVENDGQTAPT